MSALGQRRTYHALSAMSALPPIADIRADIPDVRLVPIADIVSSYCAATFSMSGSTHVLSKNGFSGP